MDSKLFIIVATIALLVGLVHAGRIHGAGRIKYGTIVTQKYPWMAYVSAITDREETPQGTAITTYNCGGTVLNEHWVLTAAHCVYYKNLTRFPPDITTIFVNSNTARDGDAYQSDMMIPHPDYKGGQSPAWDNDLALIHTTDAIKVDAFVTLGPKDFDSDNMQGSVIGWGTMENGQSSNVLRQANIKSVPKDQCPAIMFTWLYGKNKDGVRKTQICFPIDPIDGAQQFGEGDSGGPLLWWSDGSNSDIDYSGGDEPIDYDNSRKRKKRSYIDGQDPANLIQVGLVSNHDLIETNPEQLFNLFTELSQFRDWIDETIANNPEPDSDSNLRALNYPAEDSSSSSDSSSGSSYPLQDSSSSSDSSSGSSYPVQDSSSSSESDSSGN